MPDETSRVPQEVEPPTDLGQAGPPDQLGDGPDTDLFSPKDGETSTAGANYGSPDGVGSGPQDLPGGTLDYSSGLGSDEAAPTSAQNIATDSALGSDPTAMPPVTVGGQTLMAESDNATTNSNVGGDSEPEDTAAL